MWLHYGVETTKGPVMLQMDWSYFEPYWSVNPVWNAEFTLLPEHPLIRGIEPFTMMDEWYYHMRFRESTSAIGQSLNLICTSPRTDNETLETWG